MFVELTDYFKKNKFAINTKSIEYICEYYEGSKIRLLKQDGSFMKDHFIAEGLSEVCDIINNVHDKSHSEISVYYKKSLFN
jgi:hypothetical protein